MTQLHTRLGRRFQPDYRDHDHLMRMHLGASSITVLPNQKTWAISSKHLDQGNTGTCVGHGWMNFLRCAPIQTSSTKMDQWDIYRAAVLLDPWKDNDAEASLPDGDEGLASGTTVRAGAKAVMNFHQLSSYAWCFDLSTMIEWVLTKGPVVVGFNWYDSMFEPGPDGFARIKPGARIAGGHCFMVRGAKVNAGQARCVTSWGNDWNKPMGGDFYMSFEDLERLIHENGEVCTAIQKAA